MLRKSPTRTEAFLAANRRNAQKCTGPRTPEGKARSSLNRLKHGRYARHLSEKLEAAGYRSAAALHSRIRSEVIATFKVEHPADVKRAERVTALVWTMAWKSGTFGYKPQCPVFSEASEPMSFSPARNRFSIKDERRRLGLTYWVQRRRYWTVERMYHYARTGNPELEGRGMESVEPIGEQFPAALKRPSWVVLSNLLEGKLRKRVFRLRRPGWAERIKYRLDRDGDYDPDAPPPDPELRRLA